jgi:putative oxidoreductase
MKDFGLLILRLAFGALMAGHGSQKLFGWFSGPGLKGTSGWLESMGLRPGRPWAIMAGLSEFGGGALTLLGALNPLGTLGTVGAMGMATTKAHWGKPIWVTSGGAELPVLNMAAALALGLSGPGKFSVDNALGLRLPRRLILVPGLLATVATVAAGTMISNQPSPAPQVAEQAQPEVATQTEERPEAVRVPEMPSAPGLERGETQAADDMVYADDAVQTMDYTS